MHRFNTLTDIAKAMSDINRVKIITLIQRENGVCVCEICDTLELSQPLVSRHLKQLKQVGILASYKEGKWVIYTITKIPSEIVQSYFTEMKKLEHTLPDMVSCSIRT